MPPSFAKDAQGCHFYSAEGCHFYPALTEGGIEKNYYVNREHRRLQVNAPWLSPDYHRMCTVVNWDDLDLS